MKRSSGIELIKFSIENVLKKCGKWFLKMRGNPEDACCKELGADSFGLCDCVQDDETKKFGIPIEYGCKSIYF